jgi:uncharacterized membrane protein
MRAPVADGDAAVGSLMQSALTAVRARIHDLRYGFLFLPGVVAVAVALLGPLLVEIDERVGDGVAFGFHAEADAARALLATIAGSLITVAGLTFSITIVSLQLVSQQFSPRALRGFLGDRLNQVVAGTFVGTFLYSVLVLREVRGDGESRFDRFVPALAITGSVALAVISIGLLLVFIHHMAQTIQVSSITAGIAKATLGAVEPLYAETFGVGSEEDPDALAAEWERAAPRHAVRASRPGYLRSVAFEDLGNLAPAETLRCRLLVAPGDFVTEETPMLEYWQDAPDECVERLVVRATAVQSERDLHQDVDFGLRQLADIALKAISPGVNDPTTAVTSIGYIRAILERLATLPTPLPVRRYPGTDVIAIAHARPFDEYVRTALLELGRYAARDARVAGALLEAAAGAARAARTAGFDDRLASLATVADDIAARARAEAVTDLDRSVLDDAAAAVRAVTGASPQA